MMGNNIVHSKGRTMRSFRFNHLWGTFVFIFLLVSVSAALQGAPIRVKPQVAAGGTHTVGLKSDGTAVAVGANNEWQCEVNRFASWKDITQIDAGGSHTVALRSDGTVVAIGYAPACATGTWRNIIQVSAGDETTVGLQSDGSVINAPFNEIILTGIIQVSAGSGHTVGLRPDGTVAAVGRNYSGQCNVESLTGIIQVSAGGFHTVALKYDGTVEAVGENYYGQCDVTSLSLIHI